MLSCCSTSAGRHLRCRGATGRHPPQIDRWLLYVVLHYAALCSVLCAFVDLAAALAAPSLKQPQKEPAVATGAWSLFPRLEFPSRDLPTTRGGERAQVKQVKGIDGGQQESMTATKAPTGVKMDAKPAPCAPKNFGGTFVKSRRQRLTCVQHIKVQVCTIWR